MTTAEKLRRHRLLSRKRAQLLREAYTALALMDHCVDALIGAKRDFADTVVSVRNTQFDLDPIIQRARADWERRQPSHP